MAVRIATPADKATLASWYNADVPAVASFWPHPVPPTSVALMEAELTDSHQETYISDRGFLTIRSLPLELPRTVLVAPPDYPLGQIADECKTWILAPGLTALQKRAALRELFIFWFQRGPARGVQPFYGDLPKAIPATSQTFLTGAAFRRLEYTQEGVAWVRYWGPSMSAWVFP